MIELRLPENATIIKGNAFTYCTNLKKVVLPEKLENIDSYAFYHCDSLESIEIPLSVKSIGNSAFRDCRKLKSVTIPVSTSIVSKGLLAYWAFEFCTSLENIIMIGNTENINSESFEKDSLSKDKIKEIIILENVSYIYYNAFSGCGSLNKVQIMKTTDEIKAMTNYPWNVSGKIYDKDGNLVQ